MPLIVAIEPDRKQAAHLAALSRGSLRAEWILAENTGRAFAALGDRVPDLILTSALLPPKDEDALAERLRALDAAASHVQTLTIPVLAGPSRRARKSTGMLSRLTRSTSKAHAPDGCDPAVFAEQVAEYLERAAAERKRIEAERVAAAEHVEEEAPPPTEVFAEEQWGKAIPDPIAPQLPAPDLSELTLAAQEPSGLNLLAPEPPDSHLFEREQSAPEPFVVVAPAPDLFARESIGVEPISEGPIVLPAIVPEIPAVPEIAVLLEVEREIETEPEIAFVPEIAVEAEEVAPPSVVLRAVARDDSAPEGSDLDGEAAATIPTPPTQDLFASAPVSKDQAEPVVVVPIEAAALEDQAWADTPDSDCGPAEPPAEPEEIGKARAGSLLLDGIDLRGFLAELQAATAGIETSAEVTALTDFATHLAELEACADRELPPVEATAEIQAGTPEPITSVETSAAEEPPSPQPLSESDTYASGTELWMAMPGEYHRWWPPIEGLSAESPLEGVPQALKPAERPTEPEWMGVLESLRRDIERLQPDRSEGGGVEPHGAAQMADRQAALRKKRKKSVPLQDEWGFFDPDRCGMAALVAKLDEIADSDDEEPQPA